MIKIEEIREIIKLIDESSIHEFSYETDNGKISLQKKAQDIATVSVQKTQEPVLHQEEKEIDQITSVMKETTNNPADDQSTIKNTVDYDHEILSPMVGTLYSASSPDHEPFVTNGSTISEGSVVCIVEAMKLFNEIESEVSGEIVEILVKDGELVEFGQPLYRVKTK